MTSKSRRKHKNDQSQSISTDSHGFWNENGSFKKNIDRNLGAEGANKSAVFIPRRKSVRCTTVKLHPF